jgi:hypothetical protein
VLSATAHSRAAALLARDDSAAPGCREWAPPGGGAPTPLEVRFSIAGSLCAGGYVLALAFYLFVRVAYSLDLGDDAWWVPAVRVGLSSGSRELLARFVPTHVRYVGLSQSAYIWFKGVPGLLHKWPSLIHCPCYRRDLLFSPPPRYGWLVLAVEVLGATSMLPYAALLPWHTVSAGIGLPPDNGRLCLPDGKRFDLTVLVPCYKVGARFHSGLQPTTRAH